MIYCDTSLLVTALTVEDRTAQVQAWLTTRTEGELCISLWVVTEFSSALSLKLRRGEMPVDERARIISNWHALRQDHLAMLPVPENAFALAAQFCDRFESGLRAGDALHLAVAALGGHSLATLDQTMARAAVEVGVGVESVAS